MPTRPSHERLRESYGRLLAPLTGLWLRPRPRLRVLSFHDLLPGPGSPFPGRLRWLAERCRVVSLADAAAGSGLDPERLNVALTFDDGYEEHGSFAAPLLHELGLPATFFVPSAALGLEGEAAQAFARERVRRSSRSFRFLSAAALAELAAEPLFEIGGHTRDHVDLGQAAAPEELRAQIADDKAALEQIGGRPLRFFAFPFGGAEHTSAAALRALAAAGYTAAFTIMPGYWRRDSDPLLVGRDSLAFDWTESAWSAALRGAYDPLALAKWRREHRRRRGAAAA